MEEIKEKTEDLISHVKDLADTFYKLTVINITKKAVSLTSTTIVAIAVCAMGLFFIFFGGLALSWWLGNLLQNRAVGFLLVAVLFLIITGFIIYYRKKLVFPFIRDKIIREIYD